MVSSIIENPKCPHCNVELDTDDVYDMEYDYEGIILHKVGHCPECGRDYQWDESATCVQWAVTDLHLAQGGLEVSRPGAIVKKLTKKTFKKYLTNQFKQCII